MSKEKSTSPHHDINESLKVLQPVIHKLALFSRILQWRSIEDYQKTSNNYYITSSSWMLFTLLVWTSLCFHHRLTFAFALPVFIHSLSSSATTTTTRIGQHCNEDEMTQELSELATFFATLSNTFNNYKTCLADRSQKKRTLALCYLAWCWIVYSTNLKSIIWFLGSLCLTWRSPWFSALRTITLRFCRRPSTLNVSTATAPALQTAVDPEFDRLYCFTLLEHQRWWLHKGWSIPHDHPAWSDEYLEPTPSMDEFVLPPPITENGTTSYWVWVDPSWKVDNYGWQYTDWDWRRLAMLSRRRKWYRCARLEQQPAAVEQEEEEEQEEGIDKDTHSLSTTDDSISTFETHAAGINIFSTSSSPPMWIKHRSSPSIGSTTTIATATTYSLSSSPCSTRKRYSLDSSGTSLGNHFWLSR